MFMKSPNERSIPKFGDADGLEATLTEWGISRDGARKIASLGRYGLHLVAASEPMPEKPFSKIGGLPDLPAGITWPIRPGFPASGAGSPKGFWARLSQRLLFTKPGTREKRFNETPQPYNFIAQISFEELSQAGISDLGIPQTGALYLFYDDLSQCWGFDPKDEIGFEVIYVADIDSVSEAPRPDFFDEVPTYSEVRLEPVARFETCRSEGLHFDNLSLSEADKEAYFEFEGQLLDATDLGWLTSPAHKVRGWSDNIQNPMEEECALVTSGIYCGGPEGYASAEAREILDGPNEWVQLLQIDSDNDANMMWGDAGMLYLWIRKSDLERADFTNTWLILQCS